MTAQGARALGQPQLGRIAEGLPADLCLWDVGCAAELAYAVQAGRLRQRIFNGVVTNER
ncbi:Imidazolonepropionase [compost metagenome]